MAWERCATVAPNVFIVMIVLVLAMYVASSTSIIIPITPETFPNFIAANNVRLFHVLHMATPTREVEFFLSHYKKAAAQLEMYGILLGQISCLEFPNFHYCKRQRTERVLFGFRGTKERLALPISTLADENAIVASALHLALIKGVPIIQTTTELQSLQKQCFGKCNIVLAYHNTLGTLEHSLFLKLAWAYQKQHVFALTTSLHASPGFASFVTTSTSQSPKPHKQLVEMWLLQCQSIKAHQNHCDSSIFREGFSYDGINNFVKTLELPVWVDVNHYKYPTIYNSFGIHEVLVIYDDANKARVMALAEILGMAFRGSVGIVTCPLELIAHTPLKNQSGLVVAPAIAFLPFSKLAGTREAEAIILNQLENAYDFIVDQLKYEELSQITTERSMMETSSPALLKSPRAFQEDNEISKQLLKLRDTLQLSDANRFSNVCALEVRHKVTLFYLDWDPVSQMTLKTFELLDLSQYGIDTVDKISCFTNFDDCHGIDIYPTIEIIGTAMSQRFGPLSLERLIQEIYLFVNPDPKTFTSIAAITDELVNYKHTFIQEVAILATNGINDGPIYANLIKKSKRKLPLLICLKDAANYIASEMSCPLPCFGVLEVGHKMNKMIVFRKLLAKDNVMELTNELQLPILRELSPDLLPKIRSKLVVVFLGLQITADIQEVVQTSCPDVCEFTTISRQSQWFEEFRRAHAPTKQDAVLAMNLTEPCSYHYSGLYESNAIKLWLIDVVAQKVPKRSLDEKRWKPVHPAVDYLKLLENEKLKLDESIMLDTEDIFRDGLGMESSSRYT